MNLFLQEKAYAELKEHYDALSRDGSATTAYLAAEAQKVEEAGALLAQAYADGADQHCGQDPTGMKCRSGVYEVGCLVCGVRSRGDQPDEAVYNFNEAIYYEQDPALGGGGANIDQSASPAPDATPEPEAAPEEATT